MDGVSDSQLDQVTQALTFIPFDNWAKGLNQLLEKLKSINCPQSLPQGKQIAAEAFLEKDILSDEKENSFFKLFTNSPNTGSYSSFQSTRCNPKRKT